MENNKIEDIEWSKILEKIVELEPEEMNENYIEEYFKAFKKLILEYKKIRNYTVLDKDKMKKLLYDLGHMFYAFKYKIKDYNKYLLSHKLSPLINYEWVNSVQIPGGHNYNTFLLKLDLNLLKYYYDKCVEVFDEFVKSKGKTLPKTIYTVSYYLDRETFGVIKNILIEPKIVDNKFPETYKYYSIRKGNYYETAEEYKKLFIKRMDLYPNFVKKEWPVIKWIQENYELEEIEFHKLEKPA